MRLGHESRGGKAKVGTSFYRSRGHIATGDPHPGSSLTARMVIVITGVAGVRQDHAGTGPRGGARLAVSRCLGKRREHAGHAATMPRRHVLFCRSCGL
jgi:hypothetical protein